MQQGIGRKIVIAVGMLVVAGLLIVLYQWGECTGGYIKGQAACRWTDDVQLRDGNIGVGQSVWDTGYGVCKD